MSGVPDLPIPWADIGKSAGGACQGTPKPCAQSGVYLGMGVVDEDANSMLPPYGQKLERRKNLYLTGRSSLPERRVGATGSKAASAILDLSIAARRIAESEFRIEPWACDHAAS